MVQYQDWNGTSVVSIVFDNQLIHKATFISEVLDYLLPIKNGYILGGGGISPMG